MGLNFPMSYLKNLFQLLLIFFEEWKSNSDSGAGFGEMNSSQDDEPEMTLTKAIISYSIL